MQDKIRYSDYCPEFYKLFMLNINTGCPTVQKNNPSGCNHAVLYRYQPQTMAESSIIHNNSLRNNIHHQPHKHQRLLQISTLERN